jgi:hypothetical protein
MELPSPAAAYETPKSQLAPWAIIDHLQLVPRPVWIVELRSDDPYYNFGKVVLWVDRELYRVYWRQVFNKNGEEFYNAMIAHHFAVDPEGKNPSVSWTAIMGVNLITKRGALARKVGGEIIDEVAPPEGYFSMDTLTRMTN